MIPDWYFFALLCLASFRTWKLLGNDKILDRPRARFKRLFDRIDVKLDLFISCPWCLGFWICAAYFVGFVALGPAVYRSEDLFMAFVTIFAMSGVVGLLARLLPD